MNATIFKNNPELKRNILLEFSSQRLILAPLIIGLMFLIQYSWGNDSSSIAQNANWLSQIMFAIIIFGWGSWQATTSFIDEINDRTWDQQRMTSMHPATMMVGKLFGSTIYNWYAASVTLSVYFVTSLVLPNSGLKILTGITAILLGVLAHAFSIVISMLVIRKNREQSKINTRPISILSVLFSLSLISYIFPFRTFSPWLTSSNTHWYFLEIPNSFFTLFFTIFYLCWAIIGLYMLVRGELQFTNKSGLFIVFLISNAIMLTGMLSNYNNIYNTFRSALTEATEQSLSVSTYIYYFLMLCFSSAIGSAYFIIIMDVKDFIGFKKLIMMMKHKAYKNLFNEMPVYILSLLFAAVTAIVFATYTLIFGRDAGEIKNNFLQNAGIPFVFALLLFAVRDLCIFLYVNFSMKSKRTDTLALTYLTILYILFPMLASSIADKSILNFFIAMPGNNIFITVLPPAIQAAIALYILRGKFKTVELL